MNPAWITHKAKEIEMLIVKLAKAGDAPSQIGLKLRDTYGIPSVRATTEKRITEILAEKKLLKALPEDLSSLIKRAVQIRKHMERSKKDMTAVRGIMLTESKIKKLNQFNNFFINSHSF
jgi:ribosomal protein S15P/S13E